MALPKSVQIVTVHVEKASVWKKAAPLIQAAGGVRSLWLMGNQRIKNWVQVDLSLVCGLDLVRFTGFVLNIAGAAIPSCWSKMTNMESFYCTNCMMKSAPTVFKGFQKLKSFVAFRQSEMTPCGFKEIPKEPENCKPSWETKHGFKEGGMRDSYGNWGDFQEGPSFLCKESSYAFPFQEFAGLGWTNVEKVWLDGCFLTGSIPDNLPEVWPKLISLDLYNNEMSGTIPKSLGTLPFVKLQLQDNYFSGEVPSEVFALMKAPSITLGLSGNAELTGCYSKRKIGGTKITRDCNSEL